MAHRQSHRYDNADIIDSVRRLRVYVNTIDNIRTHLSKAATSVDSRYETKVEKLDSKMSHLADEISTLLSDIEASDEYRTVQKQMRSAEDEDYA